MSLFSYRTITLATFENIETIHVFFILTFIWGSKKFVLNQGFSRVLKIFMKVLANGNAIKKACMIAVLAFNFMIQLELSKMPRKS